MITAFVDESEKEYAGRRFSLLGAAIFATESSVAEARTAKRRLLLKGATKVHWYSAVPKYREEAVATIAELNATYLVVWSEMAAGDLSERSRRTVLVRLIHEMQLRRVDIVILESRQPRLDQRDLDLFRTAQVASSSPRARASHVRGSREPALWVAEILCGTEGEWLARNDPAYRRALGESLTSVGCA